MIKRILLGLGGTPFTDVAIQRAVELSKLHGALITGVTVVDTKSLKQVGPVPRGAPGTPPNFARSGWLSVKNASKAQSSNSNRNAQQQISRLRSNVKPEILSKR